MTVRDVYPWVDEAFSVVGSERGGATLVCDCALKNHRTSRLRLSLGKDNRLLVHCFACGKGATLDILRAKGLSYRDCFPEGTQVERVHQEVVARYYYRDRHGRPLFRKLRIEPGRNGRDKEFQLYRLNPEYDPARPYGPTNKRWVKPGSIRELETVLYRLPDLLGSDPARPVFVVEGEKDANSLAALGLVATTALGGASEPWRESYSESLAGRHVVVVEDADDAGRRHANEVLGSVVRVARSAAAVRLPARDATAFLLEARRRLESESLAGAGKAELLDAWRLAVEAGRAFRPARTEELWKGL